jgi:hypothetical protein
MTQELAQMGSHVQAQDACLAGSGMRQTEEHPHGGGLPGAIGTEKAKDLAPVDGEREVIDGDERTIVLG